MTNRKELYGRIFRWCADVGHCPLEGDMNELIGFFENDTAGSSPFCQRETDIPEFGGKARQVAAGQVGGDAKPAVFYCESGKSLKGLEQGALAVLSNLMIETNSTSADFMIGNEKDGEFHFHCTRGKADAPADLDAALEALDDISAAFDVEEWTATDYADIGKNIQTIRETLTGRLSGVTKSGEREDV